VVFGGFAAGIMVCFYVAGEVEVYSAKVIDVPE
jgi:hypothetical protein